MEISIHLINHIAVKGLTAGADPLPLAYFPFSWLNPEDTDEKQISFPFPTLYAWAGKPLLELNSWVR
jgi:hypothetical protein